MFLGLLPNIGSLSYFPPIFRQLHNCVPHYHGQAQFFSLPRNPITVKHNTILPKILQSYLLGMKSSEGTAGDGERDVAVFQDVIRGRSDVQRAAHQTRIAVALILGKIVCGDERRSLG